MRTDFPLIWRQVHWPLPLDSEAALGLLRRLSADRLRAPIIFEARATAGAVTYFVGTFAPQMDMVESLLAGLTPGTATSHAEEPHPAFARATRMLLRGQLLPLTTERSAHSARSLLGALSAAGAGESAMLQITLGRSIEPGLSSGKATDPTQSWLSILTRGTRPPSPEVATGMRTKAREPGFHTVIRVAATATTEPRRIALLRGLLAALRTTQAPGTRIDLAAAPGHTIEVFPTSGWLRLSSPEVLALTGWPLDSDSLPGLPNAHPHLLALTPTDIERRRVFARTTAPGQTRPIGIGPRDALFHTLLLGPTGSGKSNALLHLITRDMEAGAGIVVIDPKSDLVHDVLERVPPTRRGDVVILDPTQPHPVGFNPLASSGVSRELVADGVLTIFRELFPSAFGPRTSDVLHASLLTLTQTPGATLTWLPRLLTDARFRRSLTGQIDDPDGVGAFWEHFEALSDRQQAQFIGPVLSRLRQFLLRPSLRRVLDQPTPRFDLSEVFTQHKIVLVPLNTGLLGSEAARLLGSLLVGQLWRLTLARASQPQARRSPVSTYIDEAQEFLHLGNDLSDALARSRALGMAWHLAHQYREQMPSDTRAAIDANALNKIVFGLGIKDAKDMAAMAAGLTPEDFMSLPPFEVYASLMRGGRRLGWVSGRTLPPSPVISSAVELIAQSQARYGQPEVPANDATTDASNENRTLETGDVERPVGRKRRTP
jgi:hypothetical protein